MARVFYTEKDIEDMVKKGVQSLEVSENTVLTGLAYEKARTLGLTLIQDRPDELPNAPVRPYLNKVLTTRETAANSTTAAPASLPESPAVIQGSQPQDLQQRITQSVIAKMGGEVDAALLDSIVRRVLNSTGLS
jgi:hypothetical protein